MADQTQGNPTSPILYFTMTLPYLSTDNPVNSGAEPKKILGSSLVSYILCPTGNDKV